MEDQKVTIQDIAELADKDRPYPVDVRFKVDSGVFIGIGLTMVIATILYFIRK